MKARHVQQRDDDHGGVVQPAAEVVAIRGTVLLVPAGPGAGDNFDARVRPAWEHLKAGFYAAAEHDRLGEVLMRVIAAEQTTRAIGPMRPSIAPAQEQTP